MLHKTELTKNFIKRVNSKTKLRVNDCGHKCCQHTPLILKCNKECNKVDKPITVNELSLYQDTFGCARKC